MNTQTQTNTLRTSEVSSVPSVASSTIDRVPFTDLTPQLFHEKYRSKSRPLIFTGAFEGVDDWTLDLLERRMGTAEYSVRVYGNDYRKRPKRLWKKYSEVENHSVPAYVSLLRNRTAHDRSMYMAQVAFGHTPLAETIRDQVLQLEEKCDMTRILPVMDLNLWLGPSGHTEPLHFDTGDGTLMQLHGSKRVALFPPDQTRNLYPFPFYREIPPGLAKSTRISRTIPFFRIIVKPRNTG